MATQMGKECAVLKERRKLWEERKLVKGKGTSKTSADGEGGG